MANVEENETHILVHKVSENGDKFVVGYPKDAGYTSDEVSGIRDIPPGYQPLNWSPDQPGATSPGAQGIGISDGKVISLNGGIYSYRIVFNNTSGWSFTFIDQSYDKYYCATPRNGSHYIDYNSNNPTIVGVM